MHFPRLQSLKLLAWCYTSHDEVKLECIPFLEVHRDTLREIHIQDYEGVSGELVLQDAKSQTSGHFTVSSLSGSSDSVFYLLRDHTQSLRHNLEEVKITVDCGDALHSNQAIELFGKDLIDIHIHLTRPPFNKLKSLDMKLKSSGYYTIDKILISFENLLEIEDNPILLQVVETLRDYDINLQEPWEADIKILLSDLRSKFTK